MLGFDQKTFHLIKSYRGYNILYCNFIHLMFLANFSVFSFIYTWVKMTLGFLKIILTVLYVKLK